MTQIDKDTALRIALAARALPGIEIARLLGVLRERLGDPLSTERLTRITVTDLKTGLGSADGEEDGEDLGPGLAHLKQAVQILWGDSDDDALPALEAPFEQRQGVIRVGIASNTVEELDGHFGSCLRFLVYELSPQGSRLVDIRSTVGADLSEDRNAARADAVGDCQVVYVVSVGGPAAAKIIRRGIYPIKKPEGGAAREVLAELQRIMVSAPPPWLAKIIGIRPEERLGRYAGA